MPLRVLAVDDFEPWRSFVSSVLRGQPNVQNVVEVSDGLEAIRQAENIRPDLVVLDIGLPKLNGTKTARRIREVSPDSKILFVTAESSPEVAGAALEAGGSGYVVKSDAGRELLAAVRALVEGKRYISARLVGHVFPRTSDIAKSQTFHELQVYSDDASLIDSFARFVAGGLNTGNAVVVLATDEHRRGLDQILHARGFDLSAVVGSGGYIPMDVGELLSTVMVHDRPDAERFTELVNRVVSRAGKAPNGTDRRVLACGECSPYLLAKGKLDAALRMEELWDAAVYKFGLGTLCGYMTRGFRGSEKHRIMQAICSMHSRVVPQNFNPLLA